MDRLTWHDKDGGVFTQEVSEVDYDGNKIYAGEAINKLAQYEDLEEQGLLDIRPCKVGNELFNIVKHGVGLDIYENQIHSGVIEEIRVQIFCNGGIYSCSLSDIGKTVFLTKEEAEQKLKELNEVE